MEKQPQDLSLSYFKDFIEWLPYIQFKGSLADRAKIVVTILNKIYTDHFHLCVVKDPADSICAHTIHSSDIKYEFTNEGYDYIIF